MAELAEKGKNMLHQEVQRRGHWEFHCSMELLGPQICHHLFWHIVF